MEQRRSYFKAEFRARTEQEGKYIDGYFAVFNARTELWPGYEEEIAPGAFIASLKENDIRCLFNHNTAIVLGRVGAGTMTLKEDDHGLLGSVRINEDDRQAMDIYARVQRGDINGCSFGFFPKREERVAIDNGSSVWRILEADTHEVSVCTFPAYPQTEIKARHHEFDERFRERRETIRNRLEEIKC